MNCNLCNSKTTLFHQTKRGDYYKCTNCEAILKHPDNFVTISDEKKRYEEHNNDVNDLKYQGFVAPIVHGILNDFSPDHKGLDFGSGTGPVISKLLRDKNYSIATYDPLFDINLEALKTKYSYIACCEVMEHFHHPQKEFQLLKSLLLPDGKLYCMTEIYNETIDFDKWYYKNDDTHVIFYSKKTIQWIKAAFGFSTVAITKRLIEFQT